MNVILFTPHVNIEHGATNIIPIFPYLHNMQKNIVYHVDLISPPGFFHTWADREIQFLPKAQQSNKNKAVRQATMLLLLLNKYLLEPERASIDFDTCLLLLYFFYSLRWTQCLSVAGFRCFHTRQFFYHYFRTSPGSSMSQIELKWVSPT